MPLKLILSPVPDDIDLASMTILANVLRKNGGINVTKEEAEQLLTLEERGSALVQAQKRWGHDVLRVDRQNARERLVKDHTPENEAEFLRLSNKPHAEEQYQSMRRAANDALKSFYVSDVVPAVRPLLLRTIEIVQEDLEGLIERSKDLYELYGVPWPEGQKKPSAGNITIVPDRDPVIAAVKACLAGLRYQERELGQAISAAAPSVILKGIVHFS